MSRTETYILWRRIATVIIDEWDIPAVAVSHNVPWYAPDGPETATYTVLGVKTRRQRLIFIDGGCAITPVLILPNPTTTAKAA